MGRAALVTGGTRGIGAAVAIGLKQQGSRVAVTYRGKEDTAQAFFSGTSLRPTSRMCRATSAACKVSNGMASDLGSDRHPLQ
jgi:acetoacetyl-CoA reductase